MAQTDRWHRAPGFGGDGGPAPSALLNNPAGLALDPTGNLILPTRQFCIRRSPGGIITTVAGNAF
jgi:hypothetical protein